MKLLLTFKAEDLPKFAPEDAAVEQTWVVCFAHRPEVKVNGQEALGSVDAWHPMIPCASYDAAAEWAETWVRDAEPERFRWTPVFDDQGNQTEADELFVVLHEDGVQADIAIVPLSMLAEGSAR